MFGVIGVNTIGTIAVQLIKSQFAGESIFYIDDNPAKLGQIFNGVKVSMSTAVLQTRISSGEPLRLSIAFGEKLLGKKRILFNTLKEFNNISFPVLKHASAIVSELATVHDGNILSFGTIIGHNTVLGSNSVLWSGAVVEHDCVVGESCYLAPNVTLSGFVTLGNCCLIGSGATIMPEVKIGDNCIVGAGAVVTRDVADNSIVAGVPAKFIRSCK